MSGKIIPSFRITTFRSARVELTTAASDTPMSAKTASHMDAIPIVPKATKMSFIESAMNDVLPDNPPGLACDFNGLDHFQRRIGHEHHIGRFDGRIRAERAHGNPDIGPGDDRSVVDPVADESEFPAVV